MKFSNRCKKSLNEGSARGSKIMVIRDLVDFFDEQFDKDTDPADLADFITNQLILRMKADDQEQIDFETYMMNVLYRVADNLYK